MAVSLAVHGLLLTATWPPSPGAGGVNTPLEATLRRPTVQALPPEQPRRLGRQPAPPLLTSEAPVSPPPASVAAINDSTTQNARRSEPVGGMAAVGAASAGDGPDAEGLRSYRIALATRFSKFYPPRAIEAGWVGTTEVSVSMAADGRPAQIKVARTSGHAALDKAALAMLRQALPDTPLPESLRGRSFAVDLPVIFDLVDSAGDRL
jgi:protein TonB